MTQATAAVILAAGKGTRMRSPLPKVLHPVAGVPLIDHVVSLALQCRCRPIVVVIGHGALRVRERLVARFPEAPLLFAEQKEQLGTAHAARIGLAAIPSFKGKVLLLNGDLPLLRARTIARLHRAARRGVAFVTARLADPSGYGRVVREAPRRVRIVEDKDCTPQQRALDEINVGVYLLAAKDLRARLARVGRGNRQREYYLTDMVAQGDAVPVLLADPDEAHGVNDRQQLAQADRIFRSRAVDELLARGVVMRAPEQVLLDAGVRVAADVVLGPGVQLLGRTTIGREAMIDGPAVLRDATIDAGARVHAFSHIEGARVRKGAQVGPFARLRPEADVGERARVGNFVEMKKATLGRGAKANHLAYLGDATIGADSNIGAGTITCNYDGAHKHHTEIGAGVFVGSNSTLVAPVTLHRGAYIAAGSTITRDVPADALAFGRARQKDRPGYAKVLRNKARGGAVAVTKPKRQKPPRDG